MRTLPGVSLCGLLAVVCAGPPAEAAWQLGPETIVQAGGSDIVVNGYSVPSLVDYDGDGRKDLLTGEGGAYNEPRVRVYPNVGSAAAPAFASYTLVQADGSDMAYGGPGCWGCMAGGCLGLFPRMTDWDADGLPDMVVGQIDGSVRVYTNIGTATGPVFDAGQLLQVGPDGLKENLQAAGGRASPAVVDWDNDGRKDLLVGGLTGYLELFLNEGTAGAPDFQTGRRLEVGGGTLVVPSGRSSPDVCDVDGDGDKDVVTGNTAGELWLYANVGTDAAPVLGIPVRVRAGGVTIDLVGDPRSRPFLCDWTGDGYLDVLIGAGDGKVHLYQGVPEPASAGPIGLGLCVVLLRRRRR